MGTCSSGNGRRTRVFQRANAPDKSRRNPESIGSQDDPVNFSGLVEADGTALSAVPPAVPDQRAPGPVLVTVPAEHR